LTTTNFAKNISIGYK